MLEQINEIEILERLNNTTSVRGFFITTINILDDAIDALMKRIFLKDNFAVQSVVGPLLHDSGPLGDLSVRLKLLYGLGVVPDSCYQDISLLIKSRYQLNNDETEYQFTDDPIVHIINQLSYTDNALLDFPFMNSDDEKDREIYLLQQQRIFRSTLCLAIIKLCNELNKESPF